MAKNNKIFQFFVNLNSTPRGNFCEAGLLSATKTLAFLAEGRTANCLVFFKLIHRHRIRQ